MKNEKELTPLEKKLQENTQWGDSNYDESIDNCQVCLNPFESSIFLWEGIKKYRGEDKQGNLIENFMAHIECINTYIRIKALVFKQCDTEELEEELKGRKWIRTIFSKVRQSLKNESGEGTEAKIVNKNFWI